MSECKEFCKRLGIEYKEGLCAYYEKGEEQYKKLGNAIIDKKRILKLNEEYNFFRKWFSEVLSARDDIEKDEDLVLYNYILAEILKEKDPPLEILGTPDRKCAATDFAPMFALLSFAEEMIKNMKSRGIEYTVISDTLQAFDAEINDYNDMFGRPGMRIYIDWFLLFIKCRILRIGRLNFEMTELRDDVRVFEKDGDVKILMDNAEICENGMLKGAAGAASPFVAKIDETEDGITGYVADKYGLAKEKITLRGYREVMRKGDKVLGVHIPAHEPFTKESYTEAFEKAREVFAKAYPEYDYKAFISYSWMLDKHLRDIMKKDTNITRFADEFAPYPTRSDGSGVYTFLFHLEKTCAPENLPENSSMQRLVKEYLMSGKYFYEMSGVKLK